MSAPFGAYQYEIYFQGLTGVLPDPADGLRRTRSTCAAGAADVGVVVCGRRRR